MAISKMTKVLIVTHRDESAQLLEALQDAGIVHLLDAERAMVSKEWPELVTEGGRPRDLEDMVIRLGKAIGFLEENAADKNGASLFAPLIEVDKDEYIRVTSGQEAVSLLERTEEVAGRLEKLDNELDECRAKLATLMPWKGLETPLEELFTLTSSDCMTGLMPVQHAHETRLELEELGAAVEKVGESGMYESWVVICLKDLSADAGKILRSGEFEPVSFEGMEGKVTSRIDGLRQRIASIEESISASKQEAQELAKERLKLQIFEDHYNNLLSREQARSTAPETERVILLEGWVREKHYGRLEEIVGRFSSSTAGRMETAQDEEVPVEIENKAPARPFELITRLYGMPEYTNVDPTAVLAPFFAVFFGICLTDAGYGLVLIALLWWIMKKFQGDKKAFRMMMFCSVFAVIAGALTGGWFGDALTALIPADTAIHETINGFREKIMWFDPMKDPMIFFGISLGLGYFQVLVGLFVAFFHKLSRKDIVGALCDHLTWIIFLNSLILFGVSKAGVIPAGFAGIFGFISIAMAVVILLFSERTGGWGGRIGMGAFQLFSTVFYVGDVLSYVRLMALGMVTGGFGMAINVLVKLVMDIPVPFLGYILGAVLFVGGHLFNLGMGVLSAFVHSLRLQFVEFFPKFLVGGGRSFTPLSRNYRHVTIKQDS